MDAPDQLVHLFGKMVILVFFFLKNSYFTIEFEKYGYLKKIIHVVSTNIYFCSTMYVVKVIDQDRLTSSVRVDSHVKK